MIGHSVKSTSVLFVVVFCILLQFLSRYVAAPVTDFVLDDWACLAGAGDYPSYTSLAQTCWTEKSRPLTLLSTMVLFKAVGDRSAVFSLLSLFFYSSILAVYVLSVYAVTRSRLAALLAGSIFSVLPNLTESFHWGQLTGMAWMYLAYLAMVVGWLYYVRTLKVRYLFGSLLAYGASVFTYEVFFLMPLALLFIIDVSQLRKTMVRWVFFPAISLVYLAWRFTSLFGVKTSIQTFDSTAHGFDFTGLFFNTCQIAGWWFGDNMIAAMANGLMRFSMLTASKQYLFILAGVLATSLLCWMILRADKQSHSQDGTVGSTRFRIQNGIFFAVSALLAAAPSLVSWTSGRQNYLVGMGVAAFVGYLLSLSDCRKWLGGFVVFIMLSLFVNQGTALQWRENGEISRALFRTLQETHADWRHRKVVFCDTSRIRERMLFSPPGRTRPVFGFWGQFYNGNAEIMRGFVPSSMVKMISVDGDLTESVFDVDYGARYEHGFLVWHERYDPGKPRKTRVEDVLAIDLADVASRIDVH